MKTAYVVHGVIAPLLPFEIPMHHKQRIKDAIGDIEGMFFLELEENPRNGKQE